MRRKACGIGPNGLWRPSKEGSELRVSEGSKTSRAESVNRIKRDAGGARLSRKWVCSAATGQSTERGTNGKGIQNERWVNWMVLVAKTGNIAPWSVNVPSRRYSNLRDKAWLSDTRLDFRKKEKKATKEKRSHSSMESIMKIEMTNHAV